MRTFFKILILFISSFGFSQEQNPKTYAYDSESYMAHRHLEWGEFDESIKTQKNAIELCKLDFKGEELKYCELNGKYELLLIYAEIEDYNTAFEIAFEIINNIKTSVNLELEIKVKEELAELNFINGNYDKTIQIYNNLIELDYKNKFRYLKKLGETYFLIEDFENALLSYEKLLREITNGYKEYNIMSVVFLKKILLLQKAIGNEQGYLEMIFVSNKVIGELLDKEKNEFNLVKNKKGVFQNTVNRKIYQIISLHIDKLEISLVTKSQTSLDYAISIEKFINSLELNMIKDIITFYPSFYKVLSDAYYFNEKYEKSLTTFLKILQEEKESIKKYNISRVYYPNLKNVFKLYYAANKYNQLFKQLIDYNKFINNKISSNLMFKTEKNKSDFVVNILDNDLNQFSNFNYATNNKFDKGIIHSLNNILTSKGLLLNAIKNILSQLESLQNESINDKILQFRSKRTFINKQLLLPISSRVNSFTEQKESLELLEREIVKLYTTHFNEKINYLKDWKNTLLKDNEVAIEFTHFKVNNKKWTDSTMYVLTFTKKTGKPQKSSIYLKKNN